MSEVSINYTQSSLQRVKIEPKRRK